MDSKIKIQNWLCSKNTQREQNCFKEECVKIFNVFLSLWIKWGHNVLID